MEMDDEIKKAQAARADDRGLVGFGKAGAFDKDLYGGAEESQYDLSIGPDAEADAAAAEVDTGAPRALGSSMGPRRGQNRPIDEEPEGADPFDQYRRKTIAEREDEYHARRSRIISPARGDAFSDKTPGEGHRSYADIMREKALEREEHELKKKIADKVEADKKAGVKRRRRDDEDQGSAKRQRVEDTPAGATPGGAMTPGRTPGGMTPGRTPGGMTPGRTPGAMTPGRTPGGMTPGRTPGAMTPGRTPGGMTPGRTPGGATPGRTPGGMTPGRTPGGMTPGRTPGGMTPGRTPGGMTPGRTPGGMTPGRTPGGMTPGRTPGGMTPGRSGGATPGRTPGGMTPGRTPGRAGGVTPGRTPGRGDWEGGDGAHRSRWDQDGTPGRTPGGVTPGRGGATPGRSGGITPGRTPGGITPGRTPGRTPGGGITPGRTPGRTPGGGVTPGRTPGRVAETPGRRSRWDETPSGAATPGGAVTPGTRGGWETPAKAGATPGKPGESRRSRWDETPTASGAGATPVTGATPVGAGAFGVTPSPASLAFMTPEQRNQQRYQREMDERNRPFTIDELDAILPSAGYKILEPPPGYQPQLPASRMLATPTPDATPLYGLPSEAARAEAYGIVQPKEEGLPVIKPEDVQYFAKLLDEKEDEELTAEEEKERRIMKLLLKIKNGNPAQRKTALRQVTDKARDLGAGPLFNQILPLLMSPTLEDQERHLLVKVIDRILYKLDDLVRPYVHKILVVIEPLLIDEDYYARVEGREIISNLSKAAGLATMIATMRPDIDSIDEYVRNTTARAFSVVASALGIPALMPFLKAVCKSKLSWQARHTGIKIVQQVAILMGCAVLPHLKELVEIIQHGLEDDQSKVRTITALSIAALAEAAAPYGIESFDSVIEPLWTGIRQHRGKGLAAFLKAIGFIIPLMDPEYANYYTCEVMIILIFQFQTTDEEMKKIVLKVVKQCVATEGVEAQYIRDEILDEFFKHFWVRRMALDRRNYKQLIETTVELANKVGASEIITRIVEDLKDESEQYRKMVMETIEQVIDQNGTSSVDERLEMQLIDGILYSFQEQTSDDLVMLNGFGVVINGLGQRAKPYLPQIAGTIKWRLHNKSPKVRQQAADLISRISNVIKKCDEEPLLGRLGVVLYEYLGEEYPEVLGSILGALKAITNVMGMTKMTPPIKDLLPRLTPILKNRHEKVQENCIDLVGRVADRGSELVAPKEWMRICFELLELLKAHKKAIRRASVNTFGYIAKAVGPQDVLATLLNNLKVQERQNRVCTTIAIAIVAETCSPFTVLPALMNEYRVPELNVQNGVLKALSFLFEYIGEMGKDYIYAVTPLLEDALMDRDVVHRQIACNVVKHISLGCAGLSCEDALQHLLNYVFPNVFEVAPHTITAVLEAVEGCRVSIGPTTIMQYTMQGLFHPARKVRDIYWKIWNNVYIGQQDGMIPAFPRIDEDLDEKESGVVGHNRWQRTELDLFL